MNTKVWRNTRSNVLNFHAFAEGVALCNKRIKPNEGEFVTAAQANAQPMTHLCESCVKKMDAREVAAQRKAEREATGPRPVEAQDIATIGDATGRVIYQGNASTHKRPQGYPQVITIEPAGKGMWALTDKDGKVFKRVRGNTRLWLQPCPANIDEIQAAASAQAEEIAESVVMTEVAALPGARELGDNLNSVLADIAAPDAQADVEGEELPQVKGKFWCGTVSNRLFFHAFPERNAACNKRVWPVRADGFSTLAEVEEWEDARVCERCLNKVGQTPERADMAEAPEAVTRAEAVKSADRFIEREAPRVAALLADDAPDAQAQADAELGSCEWTDEQVEDARKAAAKRLESLRNPVEVEVDAPFEGTHKNVSYMITMAPNEKARDSWRRVALASYFAHVVKTHAQGNSGIGWDVFEGWTDGELNVLMLEAAPQSTEEAIAYARAQVVDPYREREAEALVSTWGF